MQHADPVSLLRAALADWPRGGLLVALSGGPDSTALLHALAAQPEARARGLRALHVDHGLHAASAEWAAQARATCRQLGVDFELRNVLVDRRGSGLEAAAREARRRALREVQREGEVVVMAHHAGDQAETLLWRLARGAGPEGLAAMRPLRRFGRGWLARPWLGLPHDAILRYLEQHALRAIADPANADLRHDRNYLRHTVLPALRQRWPHADAALARSADLLAGAARLLRAQARQRLARWRGLDPATLRVEPLAAAAAALRGAVLREWLLDLGLAPPGARALATIEQELLRARRDAAPRVRWPGAELRRHRGWLHAMAPLPAPPRDYALAWDGRAPLRLPGGLGWLRLEGAPLPGPARVAPRRGGERIRLAPGGPQRELKHVLQELGVPPWQRARLPLLWRDQTLLAAGDLACDHAFRAGGARLRWLPAATVAGD